MPDFSVLGKARLATCDARLQRLMNEVVKSSDCTIICGHRGQEEQDVAFHDGRSKERWPHSKHNSNPSLAVDIAPAPIDWHNLQRFRDLAALVKETAEELGIPIRWGGDFKTLIDMPHFELVDEKGKTNGT